MNTPTSERLHILQIGRLLPALEEWLRERYTTHALDNEPDPHCHRRLPYSGNMPCNGLIKTDVVYFGEALPDGALEKSYRLATQADELWVIGSTLEVMPAASIVPIAAEAGVPITIMNMGRTQYDRLADRLIHDDIAVALPQLVDETITAEQ